LEKVFRNYQFHHLDAIDIVGRTKVQINIGLYCACSTKTLGTKVSPEVSAREGFMTEEKETQQREHTMAE
jgi:hypothetical protein